MVWSCSFQIDYCAIQFNEFYLLSLSLQTEVTIMSYTMLYFVQKDLRLCRYFQQFLLFFRVNFKKNEKNYDASNSAVLRALKEAESEPKTPDEGK